MLKHATLVVAEACDGAYGELSRDEVVNEVEHALVDYVYEFLLGNYNISFHGLTSNQVMREACNPDNPEVGMEVYKAVGRLVACAMVAQYRRDREAEGELVASLMKAGVTP